MSTVILWYIFNVYLAKIGCITVSHELSVHQASVERATLTPIRDTSLSSSLYFDILNPCQFKPLLEFSIFVLLWRCWLVGDGRCGCSGQTWTLCGAHGDVVNYSTYISIEKGVRSGGDTHTPDVTSCHIIKKPVNDTSDTVILPNRPGPYAFCWFMESGFQERKLGNGTVWQGKFDKVGAACEGIHGYP